ncbi:MAG: trypsin-like peptidase domain-containing protein [Candidatus Manganitrophus sp.]|nr:MAG: trypsin-like peptidase domain-containing protein [Candidatus Manganitrophus sp.]
MRSTLSFLLAAYLIGFGWLHPVSGAPPAPTIEKVVRKSGKSISPSQSVPEVFARVAPAVVFITATSIDPFHLIDRVTHTEGSGIIIDSSGIILTSAHIVYNRQSVQVSLEDGSLLPAKLVGADPVFDLAVIQVMPPEGRLPSAPLGDSDRVRVGEEVIAIGNPLGLDQTITRGIVSAINRILPETAFSLQEPMIQTDTPINPGNSGGPLLNRNGEVIGIVTEVMPNAQNISFAIPSNIAKTILPSLIKEGRVIRPWVGFHGQFVDPTLRQILRVPLVPGELVEVIEPGSPAERAGLHAGDLEVAISGKSYLIGGDIITKINGIPLTSEETFFEIVQGLKLGTTLHLTLFREGAVREIKYPLPERPILTSDLPIGREASLRERGLPSGRRKNN